MELQSSYPIDYIYEEYDDQDYAAPGYGNVNVLKTVFIGGYGIEYHSTPSQRICANIFKCGENDCWSEDIARVYMDDFTSPWYVYLFNQKNDVGEDFCFNAYSGWSL